MKHRPKHKGKNYKTSRIKIQGNLYDLEIGKVFFART